MTLELSGTKSPKTKENFVDNGVECDGIKAVIMQGS